MRRAILTLAAGLALLTSPAAAQDIGSYGEQFLTAVKDGNGARAMELAEMPGSTVVNYRGNDGNAALHLAARSKNGNWMGYLLSRGADPNVGDATGDTPLILSARVGHSEGVARLLMRRAQVDKANRRGETALIVAVQQRKPGIVKMLLEAGANPDRTDHTAGYSARDYARRDTRSTELLKLIESTTPRKAAAVGPKAR